MCVFAPVRVKPYVDLCFSYFRHLIKISSECVSCIFSYYWLVVYEFFFHDHWCVVVSFFFNYSITVFVIDSHVIILCDFFQLFMTPFRFVMHTFVPFRCHIVPRHPGYCLPFKECLDSYLIPETSLVQKPHKHYSIQKNKLRRNSKNDLETNGVSNSNAWRHT